MDVSAKLNEPMNFVNESGMKTNTLLGINSNAMQQVVYMMCGLEIV